jgi:hypothetical protein
VVLALATVLPVRAEGPMLLTDPDEPGANLPPVGRSLFDELFEAGPPAAKRAEARYALPYPFERLLGELNERIAPARATTVLIPLGRSLQRYAADPNYFASPRVVVAITEDGGAPGRPLLKDRFYLGYHEQARVIEIISYNEAAGRFEFQIVEDYGPGKTPRVEHGERFVCVACHQAHGPIFSTALWSETNANPRVAERLSGLGESFLGAPTRAGVDLADAFDRSTDRAARLAFANFVWEDGCGAKDEPPAARCRGDLLLAALRYRLGGARDGSVADDPARAALAERLAARLAEIAPAGLAAPSPDLPNRDPLAEIEAGFQAHEAIEPDGAFEPTLRRAPILFWRPSDPPGDLLAGIVREIATSFADADVVWLDDGLRALTPADARELLRVRVPCRTRTVERGAAEHELRLTCPEVPAHGRTTLSGYVSLAGDAPTGGLIASLVLDGHAPVSRLIVTGGSLRHDAGSDWSELELREATLGLSARLASGERLGPLTVQLGANGTNDVETAAIDDLAPLRSAVAGMVEAARSDATAALGSGPLRRRAVLAELTSALGAD